MDYGSGHSCVMSWWRAVGRGALGCLRDSTPRGIHMEKKWVWAVVMEKKSEELFLEPSRAFDPPHPTSGGGGRGVDKTHGHTGENFFGPSKNAFFIIPTPQNWRACVIRMSRHSFLLVKSEGKGKGKKQVSGRKRCAICGTTDVIREHFPGATAEECVRGLPYFCRLYLIQSGTFRCCYI